MKPFQARQPLYLGSREQDDGATGFSAADANLGGKAGHILSWAVTIVAIVMLVSGITLSLVAAH